MPELLWQDYLYGKQTLEQLAVKHGCCLRTIQRHLDRYAPKRSSGSLPEQVVVLMDTTYFGRNSGVLLLRDAGADLNLYRRYVKQETVQLYADGIAYLQAHGVVVKAIVCDGRRGLAQRFAGIPVQLCQFHQVATITRYLTRNPKHPSGQELRALTLMLARTDKDSFIGGLLLWHERWKAFLDERTIESTTGRSRYTHQRLRSAYLSLKRNLPWLFTWYDHPELDIPNTTNAIDGHFADLKNKLRNHNGLSKTRKQKFIDEFLKACGPPNEDG